MSPITNFFLGAKHWQLFFLFFGLFFFGELAMVKSLASGGSTLAPWKTDFLWAFMMVVMMSSFLGWLWSMGAFLNSIVEPILRLRMGFFHFAVIYPAVYTFFFIAAFQNTSAWLFLVILPLHLLAMLCMFYLLYFVSKSLALVETGRPVSFYDYAGAFFLLWFFPIGIWIIQPRMNRHYAERKSAEPLTTV